MSLQWVEIEPGEIFIAPICEVCHRVIPDPRDGHVLYQLDDPVARVVHSECDRGEGCWVPATCVFRSDQRRLEKCFDEDIPLQNLFARRKKTARWNL